MPRTTGAAEKSEGTGHLTAEFQAAVRSELESMLAAPIFVQSSRCKRFLRFIVEETLAGNACQLKERTIGVAVFERANDYHTGDDSIVRVTANEVRKRISQFYQELHHPALIQIELPRGSYVPEFRVQPPSRPEKLFEVGPADRPDIASHVFGASDSAREPMRAGAAPEQQHIAAETIASPPTARRNRVAYGLIAILLAAAVAALGVWKERDANRVPDLWASFQNSSVPVLVCIDTHNLQSTAATTSADQQRFVDLVLRRQIISLDDATILSSMSRELGRKGIPFRVVGAEQTSLSDFRRQPVILIGAIDNQWTLMLTQNLRYRIEVANTPDSGSAKDPVASIVDSKDPAGTRWAIDFSVPFPAWKSDYAIVARMDDTTTGVPVMIEAGLGNDGTVAASELITSGAMKKRLAEEPSCKDKANFEAVIGTQIIETKSGPPHVLRLTCW